jgi:hypothetical protein
VQDELTSRSVQYCDAINTEIIFIERDGQCGECDGCCVEIRYKDQLYYDFRYFIFDEDGLLVAGPTYGVNNPITPSLVCVPFNTTLVYEFYFGGVVGCNEYKCF